MHGDNEDFSFEDEEEVVTVAVIIPTPTPKPKSRQEINRAYYLKHKTRLANQKAARWENDSEYRDIIRKGRRKHYNKKKDRERKLREAETREQHNKEQPFKFRDFKVKGKTIKVEIISFGDLAVLAKINRVTLHKWVKEGLVPQPTFITPGGHRLYTKDEATLIVKTIRRRAPKFKIESWKGNQKEDFKHYLKSKWENLRFGMKPKTFITAFGE